MLLTILIAWFLLAVPLGVLMGKGIAVGLGSAEGTVQRRPDVAPTVPQSAVVPIAA